MGPGAHEGCALHGNSLACPLHLDYAQAAEMKRGLGASYCKIRLRLQKQSAFASPRLTRVCHSQGQSAYQLGWSEVSQSTVTSVPAD